MLCSVNEQNYTIVVIQACDGWKVLRNDIVPIEWIRPACYACPIHNLAWGTYMGILQVNGEGGYEKSPTSSFITMSHLGLQQPYTSEL